MPAAHPSRCPSRSPLKSRTGAALRGSLVRAGILSLCWSGGFAGARAEVPPPAPVDQTPISVVDLQPFRASSVIGAKDLDGNSGIVTLTNLNPKINAWLLLTLDWGRGERQQVHLENTQAVRRVSVARGVPSGVVFKFSDSSPPCPLSLSRRGEALSTLMQAVRSGLPFAPLCEGRLLVRNPITGHSSTLEKVSDFLRDHTWGGDALVTLVKKEMYQDAFLEPGQLATPSRQSPAHEKAGPLPASVESSASSVVPTHLGLVLSSAVASLQEGRWYPVRSDAQVYFSALAPQAISREILGKHEPHVNTLGAVESSALAYLVAFDLARFDLHFELGTDHPRLGWSSRALPAMREANLPGPDGISSRAPLVATGMVAPQEHDATVAAFTAGFKREHGAFHYGEFASRNHGSHYGFIEQGVIFSRLQPGLATVFTLADGSLHMSSWPSENADWMLSVRDARQNGVPLIEPGPLGEGVPGAFVNQWGEGNWSGSADEDLRSLRAGLCLQEVGAQRFLIFAYFSSATPSVMARVFQAYHCHYAMHLDMNALEHTYLALYSGEAARFSVEHLIEGMGALDPKVQGRSVPRFLEAPDDRDFFYLTRKATR
jgi:hypothetical protein